MRIDPIAMVIQSKERKQSRSIPIGSVCGARFSSRDVEGMRKTLDEMLARGESGTKTNPSIFRIARYLLTQSDEFEVQGSLTGGEAEIVAIRDGGEVFITVGSDQCDRELDPLFQDKPKQMCPHPVAAVAWPYSEVRDHWDRLQIHSRVEMAGYVVTMQESPASELVDLEYLLAMDSVQSMPDPMILYCGAVPTLAAAFDTVEKHNLPATMTSGVGEAFLARLSDPVLGRSIEHRYRAVPLGDDLHER